MPPNEMTRRELLNMAWLASLGVLAVELGGVAWVMAYPRDLPWPMWRKPVDLGPVERLAAASAPVGFARNRIFWYRTPAGAIAIRNYCTHLGCLVDWKPADDKFICPCHGAQFQRDGSYIQGPAPRALDRFVIHVVDAFGREVATTGPDGAPLPLPAQGRVIVETGAIIPGQPHD